MFYCVDKNTGKRISLQTTDMRQLFLRESYITPSLHGATYYVNATAKSKKQKKVKKRRASKKQSNRCHKSDTKNGQLL